MTYGATASANSTGVEDGENVGERRVLFSIREAIKKKIGWFEALCFIFSSETWIPNKFPTTVGAWACLCLLLIPEGLSAGISTYSFNILTFGQWFKQSLEVSSMSLSVHNTHSPDKHNWIRFSLNAFLHSKVVKNAAGHIKVLQLHRKEQTRKGAIFFPDKIVI